jgi:hypothetical protein
MENLTRDRHKKNECSLYYAKPCRSRTFGSVIPFAHLPIMGIFIVDYKLQTPVSHRITCQVVQYNTINQSFESVMSTNNGGSENRPVTLFSAAR